MVGFVSLQCERDFYPSRVLFFENVYLVPEIPRTQRSMKHDVGGNCIDNFSSMNLVTDRD